MKIGLCGTMSVGKTTLVKALQELDYFKDYTFRVERSKELMALGIPLNTDSTLKGQTVFLAERTSELMCENIITDRTIVDVMAFTKSSKSINYIDKEDFCDYAKRFLKEYDYIFYVSPDGVDIEDNGVRETNSEYRDIIDLTINHIISNEKHRIKNFHEISGSTEERINQILSFIE
jgi:GTPase SAR1 family protein